MELTIVYYERRLNDDESMTSSRSKGFMHRDSEEKECPYSESDAPEVLDKILEKGLIELLESRHLEELEELMIPNIANIIGSSLIL